MNLYKLRLQRYSDTTEFTEGELVVDITKVSPFSVFYTMHSLKTGLIGKFYGFEFTQATFVDLWKWKRDESL